MGNFLNFLEYQDLVTMRVSSVLQKCPKSLQQITDALTFNGKCFPESSLLLALQELQAACDERRGVYILPARGRGCYRYYG